jgi:hypothetical protein
VLACGTGRGTEAGGVIRGRERMSADTSPPATKRADAGTVRLTGRDVAGLVWCAEMYGVPDLLESYLGVRPDRLRAILARSRKAGYADTGRLGPRPGWCWLTRPGLAAVGRPSPLRARPRRRGLLAGHRRVAVSGGAVGHRGRANPQT